MLSAVLFSNESGKVTLRTSRSQEVHKIVVQLWFQGTSWHWWWQHFNHALCFSHLKYHSPMIVAANLLASYIIYKHFFLLLKSCIGGPSWRPQDFTPRPWNGWKSAVLLERFAKLRSCTAVLPDTRWFRSSQGREPFPFPFPFPPLEFAFLVWFYAVLCGNFFSPFLNRRGLVWQMFWRNWYLRITRSLARWDEVSRCTCKDATNMAM